MIYETLISKVTVLTVVPSLYPLSIMKSESIEDGKSFLLKALLLVFDFNNVPSPVDHIKSK